MAEGEIVKRDSAGQFEKGSNPNPKGNPQLKRQRLWTKKFYEALSAKDFADVMTELKNAAKRGEKWAVLEVLNRCLGKVVQTVDATVEHNIPVERRVYNVLNILGIPSDNIPAFPNDERAESAEGQFSNPVPAPHALPAPVAPVPQEVHGMGEEQARGGDVDGLPLECEEEADE